MNNEQNDLIRWAMEKIRCEQKHRPDCCVVAGPTGPAGGPTARLFKSSNKIIHNFKQIPFKGKKINLIELNFI